MDEAEFIRTFIAALGVGGIIFFLITFTPTTMKLTTFEQAREHYRMGFFSLVRDPTSKHNNTYCVITFPRNAATFYRSERDQTEETVLANKNLTEYCDDEAQINTYEMVRAIHPSYFMGSGIRVDDKVIVNRYRNSKNVTIRTVTSIGDDYSQFRPINIAGSYYNLEELLPAPFEKQDSKAVLDAIELLKREGKLVDGKVLNA